MKKTLVTLLPISILATTLLTGCMNQGASHYIFQRNFPVPEEGLQGLGYNSENFYRN
jgi:hypothetical protein